MSLVSPTVAKADKYGESRTSENPRSLTRSQYAYLEPKFLEGV